MACNDALRETHTMCRSVIYYSFLLHERAPTFVEILSSLVNSHRLCFCYRSLGDIFPEQSGGVNIAEQQQRSAKPLTKS